MCFAMCIMPYWLSINHELYPSVSNTALLLVMPVRWSPRAPLEMVFADICTVAHGVLIFLWLLTECFMILWVANICLLLNGVEQISQIIGQLSWTRQICQFKLIANSRLISELMFSWLGVLVGPGENTDLMAQLRCRCLMAEPRRHC